MHLQDHKAKLIKTAFKGVLTQATLIMSVSDCLVGHIQCPAEGHFVAVAVLTLFLHAKRSRYRSWYNDNLPASLWYHQQFILTFMEK